MKIYETSKSLRDSKSQQNRTTNKENKQNRMNITGYQPKFFIDNLPKTTTWEAKWIQSNSFYTLIFNSQYPLITINVGLQPHDSTNTILYVS